MSNVHLCSGAVYLNKDFNCSETQGQQHSAHPDAPRCSTSDIRVIAEQGVQDERAAAEVSG